MAAPDNRPRPFASPPSRSATCRSPSTRLERSRLSRPSPSAPRSPARCRNSGSTEGQTVKKGDFLAQIDPRPYQAALAQAQGQLAKDQALLGQAQSDLSRYEALSKQDSISKQQVADQEALVAQDKAAIVTDQAQVQTAQLNLDYTHIVSPITGRVGLRLVDPGNYLQPSDANGIVVITQIDPISVVFCAARRQPAAHRGAA